MYVLETNEPPAILYHIKKEDKKERRPGAFALRGVAPLIGTGLSDAKDSGRVECSMW